MRLHLLPLGVLCLASCSSLAPTVGATPQPPPLARHDVVSTLVAIGPMIEVSFDGTECTVRGPSEVPVGTQVFKFINSTGHIAIPWVARNYPGKTWQDALDEIGTPGSEVSETWDWIAILGPDRYISESPSISYRQYDLTIEAEYQIVVEFPTDHLWPCGPFHVVATP